MSCSEIKRKGEDWLFPRKKWSKYFVKHWKRLCTCDSDYKLCGDRICLGVFESKAISLENKKF